ncbi:MAG: AAA family ATPase, partial [Candidatus Micrarchaeota archaeon]|nr:AAA family ATPase [Candidatus Micrarchaeota archaeon]
MQGNLETQLLNGMPIEVDDKFKLALNLMEGSKTNLLITGRAGTGKSTLLEYFRSITKKNVAVLAPTGVAALNVKGQTIHSFFRFKPDITVDTVKKLSPMQRQMYLNLDAIVIDEISMVRADLLDCVDAFMKANGKDASLPFGGVQMIFVGDLYQLPPVVTKDEEEMFKGPYRSQYFFDSNSFRELSMQSIELEKHHRHTEEYFIELLNAIRNNTITAEQLDVLNLRLKPEFVPDGSKVYITLTTTNRVADEINTKELARLSSVEHLYNATLDGDFDKKILPADEVLRVKEGMQIMMLNNDRAERWVNGSVGKVIGINQGIADRDVIIVKLS